MSARITVTDEMIEKVAEAMYVAERPAVGGDWVGEGDAYRALYVDSARAALEAAAPAIAAQALRDAAVAPGSRLSYDAREWLRARADRIEQGGQP